MKDHRFVRWCIAFSAFALAWFWFFSPDLFRDCIHVVFCTAQADAETDAAPNCALTEEDCLDLFHMESSEYKIAWKFF